MISKHTPEQLPAGVLRNRADKFYPALEMLMLGFMVSHMLRGGLEIGIAFLRLMRELQAIP